MSAERPLLVLLTWMDWWFIQHWTVRAINHRITPLLGVVFAAVVFFGPSALNIFGNNGVVFLVNGLLQVLVGFFIAALAAIATFQRTELDEAMGGDPPRLARHEMQPENLTRRRFLCLLFGYLSGISIVLYLSGTAALVVAPMLAGWGVEHPTLRSIARALFSFVYFALLGHMIVTSFLGLYYLVERMHHQPVRSGFRSISPDDSSDKNIN